METDITADIAGMSKELKTFIAASTKASDELELAHKETSARLLGIEQKLTSRGQGGTSSDGGGGETKKAPIDEQSGLPILSKSHKVIDNLPDGVERKGLDLSKFLRGVATGSWQGAPEERKSLDETTNAGGGFLLVPELSAQFIDIVRAQVRCVQAGAVTIPMSTSQFRIPVLNTDAVTAWHTELATLAIAAPDFAAVTAQARTLGAYVPLISMELFEDSNLVTQMITQAFARNMAVSLDAAALTGTGAPQPTGLKSNAAVLQTSVAAGPLIWDEISQGIANIRLRNYEPNAFIVGPWGAFELAKLKASTAGTYLGPANDAARLTELVTSSAGVDVYIADWTKLAFFPRTDVRIEVSRIGDGTAWSKLGISIRAYLRADVQATEPKAFQILTGYTS